MTKSKKHSATPLEYPMSRRGLFERLAYAGIGFAGTVLAPRPGWAATDLTVFDWSGYENPAYHPMFTQAHGEPNYAFFAEEEQALQKLRAGFNVDLSHPCSASINRWRDAGVIKPLDTERIALWPQIIPQLLQFRGVQHQGKTWFMPWEWGFSTVAYRPDLLKVDSPTFNLVVDPVTKGRMGMNVQFDVALAVAGIIGGFTDVFNPTDEEMARLPAIWLNIVANTRFLWSDEVEIENAFASGEVTIAYLWGGTVKRLRDRGIPVTMIDPVLPWACGYSMNANAPGSEAIAYEYLNAMLDPVGGKALIEDGYGHSNSKSFELVDPALTASYGLDDIVGLFSKGKLFDEVPAAKRNRLISEWEKARAGL